MWRPAELLIKKTRRQQKIYNEQTQYSQLGGRYFLDSLPVGSVAHFSGAVLYFILKKERISQAAQADPESCFKEQEQ